MWILWTFGTTPNYGVHSLPVYPFLFSPFLTPSLFRCTKRACYDTAVFSFRFSQFNLLNVISRYRLLVRGGYCLTQYKSSDNVNKIWTQLKLYELHSEPAMYNNITCIVYVLDNNTTHSVVFCCCLCMFHKYTDICKNIIARTIRPRYSHNVQFVTMYCYWFLICWGNFPSISTLDLILFIDFSTIMTTPTLTF